MQKIKTKCRVTLSILGFIIITNLSFAQNTSVNKSIGNVFVTDAGSAFNVSIATFKQPFEFTKGDWLVVGAIAGGTALLFTVDKNIKNFSLSNQTSLNDKIFNFDSFYGNGYTALFTTGLYGVGLFSDNHEIRELGLHASEAFIISGLVTGILKVIIGRRRPYAGDDHLVFKPFQLTNNDYHSLPSGHTTVAFAVSTVVAHYLENVYWKIFWYGAAGMVGLSRIYNNQHWASDVFLGAAIGYFVGEFVVDFNAEKNSELSSIKISPIISFNKIGLNLSF